MRKTDKTIENLTSNRVKKIGLEEPSADFTIKVMKSIVLENQPEYSAQQINYWWVLALVPLFTALGWYIVVFLKLSEHIFHFYVSLHIVIQPFITGFILLFNQLKNISISPLLLVSFLAILSLFTIEEFVHRIKHAS